MLGGPHGELGARVQVELGEDVAQVDTDGALGDDQRVGDLAVGPALRDEDGDLALAAGQRTRLASR